MSVFRPTVSAGPGSANNASAPISTTVGLRPKPYTPPQFGSFGKKSADLFKKKYEFDNQAKVLNTTNDGMAIETAIVAPTDAPLRALFKSTIPIKTFGLANGVFESTFHSAGDLQSTTSYKFNRLFNGGSIKVGLTGVTPKVNPSKPGKAGDFPEGWAFAEAEYAREYVSATAGVRSDQKQHYVDASLAAGYDSMSVGGNLKYEVKKDSQLTDYNFGAQIDGADYVASAITKDSRQNLVLSYFQMVGRGHTVGAQATLGLAAAKRELQFGTDYQVDIDTTVRASATVASGAATTQVQANVEHRLLNPNVLLGVSASFKVGQDAVSADKLGFSFTFGDF